VIELTDQQREALRQAGEGLTTLMDPQTREEYVLLRADVYARLRDSLADDDARLLEPLLADLDPEDWQDASVYERKP
jgi:hypothetical protein